MAREVNRAGLELVKSFEGVMDGNPATVNLDPYADPLGIWTIGWGHAITYNGRMLRGQADKRLAYSLFQGGINRAQAEALLRADLIDAAREVEYSVKRSLSDNEFAALVSLVFNIGAGNFRKSSVLRLVNAGQPVKAADAMLMWNKGRNNKGVLVVLPGLVRRRRAERDLFLKR